VREAMRRLELLVVSDNVASSDSVNLAQVRFPAAAWGEKDGTVTNSERRISRQRPFLPLPDEARPDWWMMAEVARRMGWAGAFSYRSAADIFREHASLSGFENGGTRLFDISGLSRLADEDYDTLIPVQWPVRASPVRESPASGTERLFGDGTFAFPSGRGRIVAVGPGRLANATGGDWPLLLNTGRVRDQWHTMTRTGLSPRLAVHVAEPFLEMHPADAAALGLQQAMLARVETVHGSAVLRVMLSERQQRGSVFAPIHWSGENSSAGRTCALVQPVTDPISGQPEAKATPARVTALPVGSHGFVLSRGVIDTGGFAYWARARMAGGHATFFALGSAPASWRAWAETLLPAGEGLTYEDVRAEQFRTAVLRDGRLEAVLYAAPGPALPSIEWLKACFALPVVEPGLRRSLLAGRPVGGADDGPVVCACFQVGRRRVEAAIASGACSAAEVGLATRAGTNCGSCLPEIKTLLGGARRALPTAAE